ncbi:BLUF domain-containing protein [Sphingomonas sp. PAMC 26605]|uniref:BLUF domain-containing protein n=1 Tax=Sphingomonas sp. PAMC 26605 TaxID=1112214 RepID=UPI00026CB17F|nr:BLUF domain-containing protein [Sphingomonas sp. PAMC 26605]
MRQILYVSLSTLAGDTADLASILEQSRHNNALDGITGLLWSDGRSFMQVLEGPRVSVMATFARILADPRHHSLIVLQERRIRGNEFGGWTMAHRRASDAADAYDDRMQRVLVNTSEGVRTHFLTLVSTGHVAALALPVAAIGGPPPELTPICTTAVPRRIDQRIGAPFHNAGLALHSAFDDMPQSTNPQHDLCIEKLRSIPRIATGDSQENRAPH